jgi:ketol-acid reductoisomerase
MQVLFDLVFETIIHRMIGSSVRSLYEKGKGFPCFVSVEQDGSGNGLVAALALSRAIGATKAGAIASSAREETMMDLFAEQALWPNIIMLFRLVSHRLPVTMLIVLQRGI